MVTDVVSDADGLLRIMLSVSDGGEATNALTPIGTSTEDIIILCGGVIIVDIIVTASQHKAKVEMGVAILLRSTSIIALFYASYVKGFRQMNTYT